LVIDWTYGEGRRREKGKHRSKARGKVKQEIVVYKGRKYKGENEYGVHMFEAGIHVHWGYRRKEKRIRRI